MRVKQIAIGSLGVLATTGLVWAQAGAARDRSADTVGFGSQKQSGQRCRLEGEQTFRSAEGFRYRGTVAVEFRRSGTRQWHKLATGRTKGSGPALTTAVRIRERVPVTVSLKPKAVQQLLDDGAHFRATAVQKLKVGKGPLERTEVLQGVQLAKCTLGRPSRFVQSSLTSGLKPTDTGSGGGTASVVRTGRAKPVLDVRARLPRSRAGESYEVWVYNSRTEAKSIGTQHVGANGKLVVSGKLPKGYRRFQFVDISREKAGGGKSHSSLSVLRGPLPD
jgi:hypothetical protein